MPWIFQTSPENVQFSFHITFQASPENVQFSFHILLIQGLGIFAHHAESEPVLSSSILSLSFLVQSNNDDLLVTFLLLVSPGPR